MKPLPVERSRPPDFSGAVGQFKFTAEGNPNRVKIGDPVTMKMKVTGSGNFDRMSGTHAHRPDRLAHLSRRPMTSKPVTI